MKFNMLYTLPLILTSLIFPSTLLADEVEAAALDNVSTSSDEEGCGLDSTVSPKTITIGEITYITGGTCIDSANQMKRIAKDFPLEIVLVQKSAAYEKEYYIADVKITIKDAKDNLVLNVVTEGPFLLADLPNGSYQISAEFRRVLKSNTININKNKHERVVFLWPEEPASD